MIKQRKIELLAPAKNLECGIEAINHGADAVYIGAPKFGARAAAVNSLEDIEALDRQVEVRRRQIKHWCSMLICIMHVFMSRSIRF